MHDASSTYAACIPAKARLLLSLIDRYATGLWVACLLAIVVLSLLPPDLAIGEIAEPWSWNYGHVVAYTFFTAISILAFSRRRALTTSHRLAMFACIVALGIVIEIVQPFFDRDGNARDVAFDMLGVAIGAWSEVLISKLR